MFLSLLFYQFSTPLLFVLCVQTETAGDGRGVGGSTLLLCPCQSPGERASPWAEEAGDGQEQGQNLELGTKIPSRVSAVTDVLEHVT